MRRILIVFILLFLGNNIYSQKYQIEISGYVKSGGSSCGTINGITGIYLVYRSGKEVNLHPYKYYRDQYYSYSREFDASDKVVKVRFHYSRRYRHWGDCKSRHVEKPINVYTPCHSERYAKSQVYDGAVDSGYAKIDIYPTPEVRYPDGFDVKKTKIVCQTESIKIQADNYGNSLSSTNKRKIYKWEYKDVVNKVNQATPGYQILLDEIDRLNERFRECLDNDGGGGIDQPFLKNNKDKNRPPGGRCNYWFERVKEAAEEARNYSPKFVKVAKWKPLRNKEGQRVIDVKLSDIYTSTSDQKKALEGVTIPIRVKPSCLEESKIPKDKNNSVSIQFLPEPPKVSKAPSFNAPTCSYDEVTGFTIYFDRQLYTGEVLNINLKRQDDLNANLFISRGKNVGINSLQRVNDNLYKYNFTKEPGALGIIDGKYKIFVTGNRRASNGALIKNCVELEFPKSGTYSISTPAPVIFNTASVQKHQACFGVKDGEIKITASGGSGNLKYVLNGVESADTFSGTKIIKPLNPGKYTIKVKDDKGCFAKDSSGKDIIKNVTINFATEIKHNKGTVIGTGFPGASSGSVKINNVWGGSPINGTSYNYEVLSSANVKLKSGIILASGGTISGLPSGIHKIVYIDANGCRVTYPLSKINDPLPISATITSTKPDCIGNKGNILINSISGGYAKYSVIIKKGGITVSNLTNIESTTSVSVIAGEYSVLIKDTRQGKLEKIIKVLPQSKITIDKVDITSPIKCFGEKATVVVSASGGKSSNYQYAIWKGASTVWKNTNTFDLAPSSRDYVFRVRHKEVTGCLSAVSNPILIKGRDPIEVLNVKVKHNDIYGAEQGEINLKLDGGIPNYKVVWSKKGEPTFTKTGTNIKELKAGFYSAFVIDNEGCQLNSAELLKVTDVEVKEKPQLLVSLDISTPIKCYEGSGTILAKPIGGSGNYSYKWLKNGIVQSNTTSIFSDAFKGDYKVEVNDGHTITSSSITLSDPTQVKLNIVKKDISCYGETDGLIQLLPQGGAGDYKYSLDNKKTYKSVKNLTNNTLSNLSKGNYTIWLKDKEGCEIVSGISTSIIEPSQIEITKRNITNNSIIGGSIGSISINVFGGKESYSYVWTKQGDSSFSNKNRDISGLLAGVYQVEVLDANNCLQIATFEVKEPKPIAVTINQTKEITCFGDSTGALVATVTGGFPLNSTSSDFTYKWFKLEAGIKTSINSDLKLDAIHSLEKGKYRVEVNDVKGEASFAEITITEPTKLEVLLKTKTNVNCFKGNDGQIEINIKGGTPNYSYKWTKENDTNFSSLDKDLVDIKSGLYTVEVTDDNECKTILRNIEIEQPSAELVIQDFKIVNLKGFETNDGSIEVNIAGGTKDYTYSWKEKGTTTSLGIKNSIDGLKAATYVLTAKDKNDCTIIKEFEVKQPPKLVITSIEQTGEIICFGDATVDLLVNVEGGTLPYTYKWIRKGEDKELSIKSSLKAIGGGTYIIEIIDGNLIKTTKEVTVNQPEALSFGAIDTVDVLCFGKATGSISVDVSGGIKPYTYSWSNGKVGASIQDLVAGDYTVTVIDKNLCEIKTTVEVKQPLVGLSIATEEKRDATGFGLSNGYIKVKVSGGTPDYVYQWKDESEQILTSITNELSNISAGTYELTVIDKGNCIISSTYVIEEPAKLEVDVTEVSILCNGEQGKLTASVKGGVPPYSYQWKDNSGVSISNSSFIEVISGIYSLEVEDANKNKVLISSIELKEPEALSFGAIDTVDVLCFGKATGSISVDVSGGIKPYTYSWSNGKVGASIQDLVAGDYTVTVIDKNLCEIKTTVEVKQPLVGLSIATEEKRDATGFGLSNGYIKVKVSGGTPDYVYQWKDESEQILTSITNELSNISAGTYELTVIDKGNCIISSTYVIEEPAKLEVDVTEVSILCNGEQGKLTASVKGGVPPYSYQWKDNSGVSISNSSFIEVISGIYSLEVEDANKNKVLISSIELKEPEALSFGAIDTVDVLCFGKATGSISVDVSGGIKPYTYSWSNGKVGASIQDLVAGDYTVTVIDKNLCEIKTTVEVKQPLVGLSIATEEKRDATGFGLSNGYIKVKVSGGTPDYVYQWKDESEQILTSITNELSNISAGTYELTVIDKGNCIISSTYVIEEPAKLEVDVTEVSILCNGEQGKLTASVKGGVPPYSYQWKDNSGVSISNSSFIEVISGIYSLEVEDANKNKVLISSIELKEPEALSFGAIDTVDVLCFGKATGSISVDVSGGIEPYVYTWSHTTINSNQLTNLAKGVYQLRVTDKNGCFISDNFIEVSEPDLYEVSETNLVRPSSDLVNDGEINIKIVGGEAPYNYLWKNQDGTTIKDENTSQKSNEITNLDEGTYTIRITDNKGCITEETYNLANPGELLVSVEQLQEITCFNNNSAVLDVITIGGAGGNKYTWYNALNDTIVGTKKQLTSIYAGSYYVIVDNAEGIKEKSAIFEVKEPTKIVLDFTTTNVTCFDEANGSFTFNVEGGSMSYTYRYAFEGGVFSGWQSVPSSNNVEVENLKPGNYKIQLKDSNNCFALNDSGNDIFEIQITQPELLKTNTDLLLNPSGYKLKNGSIEVSIEGGTKPYTYIWTTNTGVTLPTSLKIENLPAGNYRLDVEDSKGCKIKKDFKLTQPDELKLTLNQTAIISCKGEADATLKVNVIGGVKPYSYQWYKDGSSTIISANETLKNVIAETYYVIIIDKNNNKLQSEKYTITEPNTLTLELNADYVGCGRAKDWDVNSLVKGGTPPYNYLWNTGEKTKTLKNVVADKYELTVVDKNGCRVVKDIQLTAPDVLRINTRTINNPSGFGLTNGSIEVYLTGGTTPYNYNWETNTGLVLPESLSLKNLPAGRYILNVEDNKGCAVSKIFELIEPEQLTVTISQTAIISCEGENNGMLQAKVTGGVPGYIYLWYREGETSVLSSRSTLNNVSAGNYYVVINDINRNEIKSNTYKVTEPNILTLELSADYVECGRAEDWTISSKVTGGTPPYNYLWNTGENSQNLENVKAEKYELTVVDINGCKLTKEIELKAPDELEINLDNLIHPTGFGLSNGNIKVGIKGGTSPYNYSWETPTGNVIPNTLNIEEVSAGEYLFNVEDSKGCKTSVSYVLEEPDKLEVKLTQIAIVRCKGDNTARLQANVLGGVSPYTYQWYRDGDTSIISKENILKDISYGTYYVNIIDANNNKVESIKYNVSEPETLTMELNADYTNCGTANDWSIISKIEGGTPPYNYLWNTGNTTSKLTNVKAATYELTVVDANGCRANKDILIELPEKLVISNDELKNVTCYRGNDGKINIDVKGGLPPYSYKWNNEETTAIISNLQAGEYSVTVTDIKGCKISKTYIIEEPDLITVDLGDDITLCKDQSTIIDGTIDDGKTYSWTSDNGFISSEPIIEVADAGTYTVNIITNQGCEASDTIVINTLNNDIDANFIVSTQVFVNESFIAANVSSPSPDQSAWLPPIEAKVIEEGTNYIELLFEEVGEYEVTLITTVGDCEEVITKKVFVVEKEVDNSVSQDNSNQPMIEEFVIYPNPSSGEFKLDIKLKEEHNISVRIFAMQGNNFIDMKKANGKKEYTLNYNLSLVSGAYVVLVETKKERLVKKIIIK
ncbi:T9SS type A sorting domain-containing protein [Tenacibaculum sp. 190524A02b]|uniref:T9SS type A sorting domain-containing protein n=1 Tax=Tenacibaculum vairaonense TaxID=3137860 RepID=UPI0031FB8B08